MRYCKYICLLGMFLLGVTSCVDLNQEPQSFLTPQNIESTPENNTALAEGLYAALWQWNYGFNCRSQILGMGADDIQCGMMSKRYLFGDKLNFMESQFDQDTYYMWTNMYRVIYTSNMIIEAIDTTASANPENKQFVGEALFMRAFAYFTLVRYFGDVPLFKSSTCEADIFGNKGQSIPRSPVSSAYDFIIVPDLLQAIDLLPEQPRTNNNASVSRWAAKVCLADVYLTMAGWPLHRQECYALARDMSDDVVSNSPHRLLDHYADLWKEATKSDNTEHIFALNHSVLYMRASNYGKSYYVEEEDVSAWSDYVGDSAFYTKYPNDERRAHNYITKIGTGWRALQWTQWGIKSPAIAKYRDYGDCSSPQSNGITPIYRYADALLIYAEAQCQADGAPNSKAYANVNAIRKRAKGGVANPLREGLDKDAFLQAVYDERGWEFFAEFKRWFELVRTERVWDANQYNPKVKNDLQARGITRDNRNIYLWPLPTGELRLTNWAQNPR